MTHQAGTSTAPPKHHRCYDVFLNFRGPDTRLTIVDILNNALTQAGFRVFYDDEGIQKGETIGGELLSAIANSKIYIPIFSKNYASSKWCLREIAHMVDLKEKSKDGDGKVILPMFYDVDAADVKLKTELYREAMEIHEKESGKDEVDQWKKALREIARIKGFNLKDHGLAGVVDLIQKEVFSILNEHEDVPLILDRVVGIQDQIEAFMQLLDEESPDVRFLVIHGTGGIGKTTLAKSIYRKISANFQGSCILSDVRRSSSVDDMVKLQKDLLLHTLNIKYIKVSNIDDGIEMISRRLRNKKVLIILDDVDKRHYLKNLVAKSSWFGSKSRIIITTRNIDILENEDTKDYYFYEIKNMDHDHALELFCRHAFENDSPLQEYYDISIEIVATTGGLPLALEVIGSSLYNQDKRTWNFILDKLKEAPHKDVQKTLMISYDALEDEQQQIFLDIACFFNYEEKTEPIYFWEACKLYPRSGIKILVRRSLIKVTDDDKLWMHDQLRDLGKIIAQPKTLTMESVAPIKPSRLWSPKVALDVVQKKEKVESIVALQLSIPDASRSRSRNFVREEFAGLVNLKFLRLMGGNFEGDFTNVFQRLRWLSWFNCPLKFQATNLSFDNLVVLKLSGNHISETWDGWRLIMVAKELKVLNLTSCVNLTRPPSFCAFSTLERLILTDCHNLEEIDRSINELRNLKYLEISNTSIDYDRLYSMEMLPQPQLLPDYVGGLKSLIVLTIDNVGLTELHSSIGELVALEHLCLKCPQLGNLPSTIGNLTQLLKLEVSFSGIKELPDSIGHLKQLQILRMSYTKVCGLPESIGRVKSLTELDLSNTRITELPESIGNLKRLKVMKLSVTPIKKLPKTLGKAFNLEELYVLFCKDMDGELPEETMELFALRCLDFRGTHLNRVPTTINQFSHLQTFVLDDFDGRLPELPKNLTSLKVYCSSLELGRLPDLSNLTNLVTLELVSSSPHYSQPQDTAANMDWLVRLTKLEVLILILPDLKSSPIDFSSLSQLQKLAITCFEPQHLTRLPPKLEFLNLHDVMFPIEIERPLFSTLKNVSSFELESCWLSEIHFDALEELEILRNLRVTKCEQVKRLSSLSCLKNLREITVCDCAKLLEIQGLEEVKMLQSLLLGNCKSIQRLPNLSSLQKLESLTFRSCESLSSLPDVANKEICYLTVDRCARLADFEGLLSEFLDEEEHKKDMVNQHLHLKLIDDRLEEEYRFYFNMKDFEDAVRNGNWDKVERYLFSFRKFGDNQYLRKMFFYVRRQKYLEALDRQDWFEANNLLRKDLVVFEENYKKHIEALRELRDAWASSRELHHTSSYGDTKSNRALLLARLKKNIIIFCEEKQPKVPIEKFKEAIHRLEQEQGFCFDIKYFENDVENGKWDEVERYLSCFTRLDDNRHSMKMLFHIKKQKYLEALDRQDRSEAENILTKDLKVFSKYYEDDFQALSQLLTLENFRQHEQFSWCGDTTSARALLLGGLKEIIINCCKAEQRKQKEEKLKETLHKLERDCGFFFDMKYLEDKVQNGNWDEAERYLSDFIKLDDNKHLMKLILDIRVQKYLEALDRQDQSEAKDILKDLTGEFSKQYKKDIHTLSQLLTLENFRKHEKFGGYVDTQSARALLLVALKELIFHFCEEKQCKARIGEKSKKTIHSDDRLTHEYEFNFDIDYFENEVRNGNWDEVESYLSNFTKLDDNIHSMKMILDIRKHKYLEALDRQDRHEAENVLKKDLKVFSKNYEDLIQALAEQLTSENFRKHHYFRWYINTESARAYLLAGLRHLIFYFWEEKQRRAQIEEKFKKTIHRLKNERGIYFDMQYFEDKVLNGNLNEVEGYLFSFMKLDDNEHSMKMIFDIRKHKYLEALDRDDRSEAEDVLIKDLQVFSQNYEELFQALTEQQTSENFRKNQFLQWYINTQSARAYLLVGLQELISLFWEVKLQRVQIEEKFKNTIHQLKRKRGF